MYVYIYIYVYISQLPYVRLGLRGLRRLRDAAGSAAEPLIMVTNMLIIITTVIVVVVIIIIIVIVAPTPMVPPSNVCYCIWHNLYRTLILYDMLQCDMLNHARLSYTTA